MRVMINLAGLRGSLPGLAASLLLLSHSQPCSRQIFTAIA